MVLDIATIIQSSLLLFIITDPLGNVPIYYSVTKTFPKGSKNKIIQQAILTGMLILILFAVAGNKIFDYFNLSFESFLIAGGALLFLIGLDMIRGHLKVYQASKNFGIVPLGIPLIAGPGYNNGNYLVANSGFRCCCHFNSRGDSPDGTGVSFL